MQPDNYEKKRTDKFSQPISRQRTVALGNYKPVDPANPGFGPQGTMTYGELAAFIAMLFWMDDAKAPATPFDSFYPAAGRDQVTAILNALNQGGLASNNKLLNTWQTLMGNAAAGIDPDAGVKQALDALHADFKNLVDALGNVWDGCATVGLDMVERIASLK